MVSPLPAYNSMVASATVLAPQRRLTPQYASWQEQLWQWFETLGEYESAVSWRSKTMSRVRLLAAKLAPGGDEPEPVEDGPAAEAVGRLAGGTGGQTQLMAELTTHLSVPGEAWLVGEDDPEADTEVWSVRSAEEIRVVSTGGWQLRDDPRATAWRTPANVMVVRVWDPHPRRGWEADPAARHAFSAMTKLDLANKRIIATLISRLASNGILLYDKERLSLPTTPQTPAAGPVGAPDALGGGEPDPWAVLFVDVASRGIKDPTSPEAVIPVPIGYSLADLANVDPKLLIQHITFASDVDDKLLAQRQDALRELATALDMPVEALVGMGDMSHWGAWNIEEQAIKIHVAPTAELICHALTVGYLKPYLEAAGEDPKGLIVWYDPSELTLRPDRSANTLQAYEALEASGPALRREFGLSEDDKPDEAELRSMILKKQAGMESLSSTALAELTGTTEAVPAVPGGVTTAPEPAAGGADGQQGPPGTLDQPPPDGGPQAPPDRAALAAMDPAVLATLADDVAAVLAAVSPGSRWVDPLTPVRHANSH